MAVIALASAAGSPGVTTTCVGLALLWPRPVVLIDADPTGGSGVLAGYFRGTRAYETGLIELALSPVEVSEALRDAIRPFEGSGASYVAGTRSHAQAAGLRELWPRLAEALAGLDELGQDVVVDAGRLGLAGSPEPVLAAADVSLLLTRSHLPALAAARSRAEVIAHRHEWANPAVAIVGEGQPYRSAEVSRVLGLPVMATVADDPDSAAVFSRGATPGRNFDSSALVRSLRSMIAACQAHLTGSRSTTLAEVAR